MPSESLDLDCPFCGYSVHAARLGNFYLDRGGSHALIKCPRPGCARITAVDLNPQTGVVETTYPSVQVPAAVHPSIPAPIAGDWIEAFRCRSVGAHKATVQMSRRVMQAIVEAHGAEGRDLFHEIDDLLAKGFITKSLHEAAHEVRHFGAFGAHPRDDGLDNITRDDAERIMDVVGHFLTDLYVRPAETAKLRGKRQPPASATP